MRRYLELSDWNLKEGIRSAKEDNEWERELGDADALHSGQIRIKVKGGRLQASGAGLTPQKPKHSTPDGSTHEDETDRPAIVTPKREPHRITTKEAIPDIATKTVKAHDLYAVSLVYVPYAAGSSRIFAEVLTPF